MRDCAQARRLFGPELDDEITQAEREWLGAHLVACAKCRDEYEALERSLEWLGSLPRQEASPELLERTLARTRHSAPEPDRVAAQPGRRWAPATAAAAVLLLVAGVASQWVGLVPLARVVRGSHSGEPRQPVLVGAMATQVAVLAEPGGASSAADAPSADLFSEDRVAVVPDSVFNHGEDVEFILDPVTINRGRAAVSRQPAGVQGQQAVITF